MAIKVGQRHPKTIQSEDIGAVRKKQREQAKKASQVLSPEQRKKLYDNMMMLPPDKQVKALRDVGLEEEANALQKKRAEENMQKNQAEWRKKRLQEINALPLEDQLSVLLEEGFTEEAKELSERLAAAQEEQTGEGSGEVNEPHEEQLDAAPADLNEDGGGTDANAAAGDADAAGTGQDAGQDAAPENGGEQPKKRGGRPKKDAAE